MAVLGVEVVMRPVKVRGHAADKIATMLMAVALAELDAGDLRHAIRRVRFLHRPRHEAVLADRHLDDLGVDAGAAEEEQLLDLKAMCRVHDGVLNLEVVQQEIDRVRVAGLDAAHRGSGEDDVFGALSGEEGIGYQGRTVRATVTGQLADAGNTAPG